MIGLVPFIVFVVAVTYIGLKLAKHGIKDSLLMLGSAIYAAGYMYEHAKHIAMDGWQQVRETGRKWYAHKLREEQSA